MTFPILGGNGAVGVYSIDNSVRLNDNDSAGFSRTNQASPTDAKIFTWSGWVKRGNIDTSSALFWGGSGNNVSSLYFRGSGSQNYIRLIETSDAFVSYDTTIDTQMLFRDVSAWYHIVLKYDSTNATANDRAIIYVNGVQVDLTISNTVNSNYTSPLNEGSYSNYVGRASGGNYMDGYMAEVHFIDGQALSPTDFGEFDEDSGIWKPIQYTGTYGNNGFYLDFENSGSLGADQSGNSNDFTPTNLASTDQTTDTPTNNFCTLNPVSEFNNSTFSEGNLKYTGASASVHPAIGTIGVTSGKWYFEGIRLSGASAYPFIGAYKVDGTAGMGGYLGDTIDGWCMLLDGTDNGEWRNDTTLSGTSAGTFVNGDIANIAIDMDNGKIWFGRNGTWANSGNPSAGTGEQYSNLSGTIVPAISVYTGASVGLNFGQDGSFAGNKTAQGNADGNGYGDFYYAPPSGYLALCTQNLATALSPTIDDGSQYFNTVLYTGTGTTQSITGVGFQPDWVWLKDRDLTYDHQLHDSSRGASAGYLASNNTNAENPTYPLTSFDSDGWTTVSGGTPGQNASSDTFVSWNWLVNGGTTSSNTDGSITSTVQANTTAGFSIVTYTGTGSNATVGHGLGVAPKMVIVKRRDSTGGWWIHNTNLTSASYGIRLDTTGAEQVASAVFNDTFPTSTVFSLGTNTEVNTSSATMVAYCFAEIEGYSKFGSYTGNANTDGTFVYTGFKPAFTLIKRTNATQAWVLHDSARAGYINPTDNYSYANATNVEAEDIDLDYLSNGFKIRDPYNDCNASGGTYIYMAFAESPFVTSTSIPVTAR